MQTTQTTPLFSQNPLQVIIITASYPQVSPSMTSITTNASAVTLNMTTTITSVSSTSEPISSHASGLQL